MRKTVKDFARAQSLPRIFNWTMSYVNKNPEINLLKLLNYVKRIAPQAKHKDQIDQVKYIYQSNPVIHAYVNNIINNVHPKVKQKLMYNFFFNNVLFGVPKQQENTAKLGVNIPNLIVVSPTSACNLRCTGCWAGKYKASDSLSPERFDRLLTEAKELGIYWIVLTGGEPLFYPYLFDLMAKHHDMTFMAYTNGTLINEKVADRIVEVGNFSPALSLEGWREQTDARRGKGVFDKVMRAMDLLKERGAIYGVSFTFTRDNVMELTSDEFIDFLVDKGVLYGWSFHYIPVGREPDVNMMITIDQRMHLAERIPYLRTHKPILIADFWNDGEQTEGCIAGGRRYFHITANGEVEPCAFVHFAVDNIYHKSLLEVLKSPLFSAYQKRQPFSKNYLRVCPIIDHPEILREIVAESKAHPTHEGAETVLEGTVARCLDRRAQEWGKAADDIWAKKHGQKQAQGF